MPLTFLARFAGDDGNPTHYENRLTADLGRDLGLNEDDVRRADLDGHAADRFGKLTGKKKDEALARYREIFDLDSFLKTLTDEINRHDEKSPKESLPCQFIDWANASLKVPHVIFDDSCMKVEVEKTLVMACLEALFAGKLNGPADESYRDHALAVLFEPFFAAAAATAEAATKDSGKTEGQESNKTSEASKAKGGKGEAKGKGKGKGEGQKRNRK
eukprot:gb/GFBE01024610.1/.p1 GENE.gb/GFBE01024610.1/~~gb/GFBE01024610.1/.p1  ORF type:complete len:216 (+),score=67.08 gb/GFBE01024610.1/:1-648(+)